MKIKEAVPYGLYKGIIEFIIKDRNGNVVDRIIDSNIVKIFGKELLSHRLPSAQVWDPDAATGTGAWVDADLYNVEEFAARYILFGASFDENGVPLGSEDTRYYAFNAITQQFDPIRLTPGAGVTYPDGSTTAYSSGLINAIPLAEPDRPLKRVESISFEPTYQPAGSPFVSKDVRAINNIVVFETTLRLDEYNGFGLSDSDFFTITEVALAGGRQFDTIGDCECLPKNLFLEGTSDGNALLCSASGTDVISIDPGETEVNLIKEGDQIKIVAAGATSDSTDILGQLNPFYLVLNKASSGRDIQLDRVPIDTNSAPLTGDVGVFRDTLKIFSHRILKTPVKKSGDFSIVVRWSIIFN